jgi:hypothetical protein
MRRGWGHLSIAPTSLNTLDILFFFYDRIVCHLFDDFQNLHFNPTLVIRKKLNLLCRPSSLFEYLLIYV